VPVIESSTTNAVRPTEWRPSGSGQLFGCLMVVVRSTVCSGATMRVIIGVATGIESPSDVECSLPCGRDQRGHVARCHGPHVVSSGRHLKHTLSRYVAVHL